MKRGLLTSVCVLSGLILSGCGGGGGGELTGAGGAPTITTTPTNVSTTISSIPSQQLASFGDGASAERFVSSDGLLYTGIFDDPLLKSVIENEAYTVSGTPTSGSANGVNYQTTYRNESIWRCRHITMTLKAVLFRAAFLILGKSTESQVIPVICDNDR